MGEITPRTSYYDTEMCWSQDLPVLIAIGSFEIRSSPDLVELFFVRADIFPVLVLTVIIHVWRLTSTLNLNISTCTTGC